MKNREIVVGFDTEFVQRGNRRDILSYQFFAIDSRDASWSLFRLCRNDERLKLRDCILELIEEGLGLGVLSKVPTKINLIAHLNKADITAFAEGPRLLKKFDAVRKSFTTLSRPKTYDFNGHKVSVSLRDSILLAPAKTSLEKLGDLIGLEKLELPEGYKKDSMDVFQRERPEEFKEYGMRDAEIAARWFLKMEEFGRDHLQDGVVKPTLSSYSEKILHKTWEDAGIDRLQVLGLEMKSVEKHGRHGVRTKKCEKQCEMKELNDVLAKKCFHGGRNESYYFGWSQTDNWKDYDLVSAYVTAMMTLNLPLWDQAFETTNLDAFNIDYYGLAKVRFKFPTGVKPCLPVVHEDSGCLVYTMEGKSFCATPEILAAISMGAELEVLKGLVIPTDSSIKPFQHFAKLCNDMRKNYEKGTPENALWKEVGNSLYGRVAMGLGGKRNYDPRTGGMRDTPESGITCPVIAATITSLVRASGSELLNHLARSTKTLCYTTDGFISNATPEQVAEAAESGVVCRHLAATRLEVMGDARITEIKKEDERVLVSRTRGNASPNGSIIARGGLSIPSAGEYIEAFEGREGRVENAHSPFTPIRDLCEGGDFISSKRCNRVSMECDWRGEPVNPRMVENHLAFDLKPWQTVDDFQAMRESWKRYEDGRDVALKSLEDFEGFMDYHNTSPGDKVPRQDTKARMLKRYFAFAVVNGLEGLSIEGHTYKSLAAAMSGLGYPATENDFKNATQVKKPPQEVEIPEELIAAVQL